MNSETVVLACCTLPMMNAPRAGVDAGPSHTKLSKLLSQQRRCQRRACSQQFQSQAQDLESKRAEASREAAECLQKRATVLSKLTQFLGCIWAAKAWWKKLLVKT